MRCIWGYISSVAHIQSHTSTHTQIHTLMDNIYTHKHIYTHTFRLDIEAPEVISGGGNRYRHEVYYDTTVETHTKKYTHTPMA